MALKSKSETALPMTYSPPLGIFGNYIGVNISPGPWFVGTACPRSVHKWGVAAVVCGNVHKVETTYHGLSTDDLSKLNKPDFFPGLLGNDILSGYDILFNLNSRKKKTDTEGIMYIGNRYITPPAPKVFTLVRPKRIIKALPVTCSLWDSGRIDWHLVRCLRRSSRNSKKE